MMPALIVDPSSTYIVEDQGSTPSTDVLYRISTPSSVARVESSEIISCLGTARSSKPFQTCSKLQELMTLPLAFTTFPLSTRTLPDLSLSHASRSRASKATHAFGHTLIDVPSVISSPPLRSRTATDLFVAFLNATPAASPPIPLPTITTSDEEAWQTKGHALLAGVAPVDNPQNPMIWPDRSIPKHRSSRPHSTAVWSVFTTNHSDYLLLLKYEDHGTPREQFFC
mmetsp:Transcript_24760/g.35668  ORF Transcript_24760/g.35668 Transcript_24760/m.35668 type:complete len:226 (-) Transcript_24760:12-689(-)